MTSCYLQAINSHPNIVGSPSNCSILHPGYRAKIHLKASKPSYPGVNFIKLKRPFLAFKRTLLALNILHF